MRLRHGESEWNAADRFTGWQDIGLSARGERQALSASAMLRHLHVSPDVTYTSTLKRTAKTAWIVHEHLDSFATPIVHSLQAQRADVRRAHRPSQGASMGPWCESRLGVLIRLDVDIGPVCLYQPTRPPSQGGDPRRPRPRAVRAATPRAATARHRIMLRPQHLGRHAWRARRRHSSQRVVRRRSRTRDAAVGGRDRPCGRAREDGPRDHIEELSARALPRDHRYAARGEIGPRSA